MPQSSNELRNKFFIGGDGIEKCEDIIISAGGSIKKFMIKAPKNIDDLESDVRDQFWDAVQFLLEEWDYGFID